MGYSNKFSKLANFLFKYNQNSIDIFVHTPKENTNEPWIIVSETLVNEIGPIKGTGMSKSKLIAFTKALVELAEVFIMKKFNYKDRDGFSGGVFRKTAIIRAKAELIERDAFLYHYRNEIPFTRLVKEISNIQNSKKILVYEMCSADSDFYSYIATDYNCANGLNDCLLIGLGCHIDREVAIDKAIAEYSTMLLDHQMRPNWCEKIEKLINQPKRLPDFHHANSRDIRNITRFKELCNIHNEVIIDRKTLKNINWIITDLQSPIYFFKFIKIESQDLQKLEFGIPEVNTKSNEQPLYHPIW